MSLAEIKNVLACHATRKGFEDPQIAGLFLIIAQAGHGKSFVSTRISKLFDVTKTYTNEPDVKVGDPGNVLLTTWEDILNGFGSETLKVVDSMSTQLAFNLPEVSAICANSKAGARSEGLTPEMALNLTTMSQKLVSVNKVCYITLSLAEFTPEKHPFIMHVLKGFSNGVIWSENRMLKVSYRKESDRDVTKSCTMDELVTLVKKPDSIIQSTGISVVEKTII